MTVAPPAAGTLEAWAWDILHRPLRPEDTLGPRRSLTRVEARPLPSGAHVAPSPRRRWRSLDARGEVPVGQRAARDPRRARRLVHTFLHHELQAAELMAWAILAFPEDARAFRAGS
jgi:hypothetical protein